MKRLSYSVSPIVTGVATLSARSSSGTVFEWPTTSARSCGFKAASRDASARPSAAGSCCGARPQRVGQRLRRLDRAPAFGGEDVRDAGVAQHVSQPVRASDAVGRERRVGRLIEPLGMPDDVDRLLRARILRRGERDDEGGEKERGAFHLRGPVRLTLTSRTGRVGQARLGGLAA